MEVPLTIPQLLQLQFMCVASRQCLHLAPKAQTNFAQLIFVYVVQLGLVSLSLTEGFVVCDKAEHPYIEVLVKLIRDRASFSS